MQTHIQPLLQHRNPLWSTEEQYDARKTASDAPMRKNIPDKPIMHNVIWSLLLWSILTMCLSGCKISECRKAEEVMYAKYRYSISNDSLSDIGKELGFDCEHRYTRKYIRKHLGRPLRIYILDDRNLGTELREDWIYIAEREKHPDRKPFISSLLVLSFYLNKPGLIEQGHGCPELQCHLYSILEGADEVHTDAILLVNSDSFNIKYPYIIKNEQKFHHGW